MNWRFLIVSLLFQLVKAQQQKTCSSDNNTMQVKLEDRTCQDLIEFVETGRLKMVKNYVLKENTIKERLVMVMGITGTGKSTLVNYLAGVPLVYKKLKGKPVIDIAPNASQLPGDGFQIGHTPKSKTLYPAIYSPPGENFTFVDNPGFADTRGIEIEIANAYFREQVTKEAHAGIKIIIIITQSDIEIRGQQFRKSLKGLKEFLGVFDNKNTNNSWLAESIGIVVTRIEKRNGDSDGQLKIYIKDFLLEILNEEVETGEISIKEEEIFRKIIKNDQIELSSNFEKEGPVPIENRESILAMIDRLVYASKEDLKIRVKIDQSFTTKLLAYVEDQFDQLDSIIEGIVTRLINGHLSPNETKLIERIETLRRLLTDWSLGGVTLNSDLMSVCLVLDMSNDENIYFKTKLSVLDFFLKLLPTTNQQQLIVKQGRNIANKINPILQTRLAELTDYYERQFEKKLTRTLEFAINNFTIDKLGSAKNLDDINQLRDILSQLDLLINRTSNFTIFIQDIGTILNETVKTELLSSNIELEQLLSHLSSNTPINNERSWLPVNIVKQLGQLLVDIALFYTEKPAKVRDGIYEFKGYFGKLSSIQADLLSRDIERISSVRVLTSHSFLIDSDFSISLACLNFLIISPHVNVTQNVTIDLSCGRIPGYPDGEVNVRNNHYFSINGANGKPGLSGYNGGHLMLVTNRTSGSNMLHFVSQGGKGGPGQNGN